MRAKKREAMEGKGKKEGGQLEKEGEMEREKRHQGREGSFELQ